MSETPVESLSFEDAMAALEKIVGELEGGTVPLEQSIALYERGAALKKLCEDKLRAAEEKVAQITVGPDGRATGTKPFEQG